MSGPESFRNYCNPVGTGSAALQRRFKPIFFLALEPASASDRVCRRLEAGSAANDRCDAGLEGPLYPIAAKTKLL